MDNTNMQSNTLCNVGIQFMFDELIDSLILMQ